MRIVTTALILALSCAASAQERPRSDNEIVFTQASELLSWCEQEARAHFAGLGVTTYQWSGRHYESGNTLHAEGQIRTSSTDVRVTCLAAKGARERHATIRIGS